MDNATHDRYREITKQSRLKVLDLIYRAQTSHIGSNFSVAEIMTVLFENTDLDKDKIVLSAGWKAAMLYYHLWRKGRMTTQELDSYCMPGSKYIGLAEPVHQDIPFAGGSMGMGLAAGSALAWSKKQLDQPGRVYVVESDGGMQVGITWESLWFAVQHNLANLTLIMDNNGLQAMGKTKNILDPSKLPAMLRELGWVTSQISGHSFDNLEYAIKERNSQPHAIFACTIKGKGVSWMENNNLWHYAKITDDDYKKAFEELANA